MQQKVGQVQPKQKAVIWESVKSVSFGQMRVDQVRVGHLRPYRIPGGDLTETENLGEWQSGGFTYFLCTVSRFYDDGSSTNTVDSFASYKQTSPDYWFIVID